MKKCNDCIHYEICEEWSPYYLNGEAKKCSYFKNKRDWIALPCLKDEQFTHICKSKGLVNGFSIFAKVLKSDDENVTIDRFQKFGALHIGAITISKSNFDLYYDSITEAEKKMHSNMGETT